MLQSTAYIKGSRINRGECICTFSAGAHTTTSYVMVDIMKGGGRAPPRQPEAEFLDVIWTKVFRVFLLSIHCHLFLWIYSPSPLSKSGLKLGCNYIIYGNLKSEISTKLYIMNSASGQLFYLHDGMYARKWPLPLTKYVQYILYDGKLQGCQRKRICAYGTITH